MPNARATKACGKTVKRAHPQSPFCVQAGFYWVNESFEFKWMVDGGNLVARIYSNLAYSW